jgi:hypothetical protein
MQVEFRIKKNFEEMKQPEIPAQKIEQKASPSITSPVQQQQSNPMMF